MTDTITLDTIDDLTPQFRRVFPDLCARLWTMVGANDPDHYTGLVTVEGGNLQIGLADRAKNLAAMTAASLGEGRAEAERVVERLLLPRAPRHLRVLLVSPQAVLVLDAPTGTG
jgi:hypothetical protein